MKKPAVIRQYLILFIILFPIVVCKVSSPSPLVELSDHKEWKKLLRTKTNILAAFTGSKPGNVYTVLNDVSRAIKGTGTVVRVDCDGSDGKKLCKKLKVKAGVIKHFKNGDFHKDYDRKVTVKSMVSFMRDPTGELPWDEDDASVDVQHIMDANHWKKFLKKEKGKVLVMFYAPWCGFCKRMKPDYNRAATELKGESVLAAVDVTKPENAGLSKKFNITGFPTLIYFQGGNMKYQYPGENNQKSLVEFMRNPSPESKVKPEENEPDWKEEPSEVEHLTDETFDEFLENADSVLVMFYAPWCGHCKRMKPHFTAAAEKLKTEGIQGKLAAVDCTKERNIANKFGIKGYPTVKYFKSGEFKFDAGHARETEEILKFMRNPTEPPPPPPPEVPWSEEESHVVHLDENNFKPFLKKKKHVLVMFYAPWCGHCKKAKPELTAAAEELKDNPKSEFAAVDCTKQNGICSKYEVSGYPTFKFFKYYDKDEVKPYEGGRSKADFVRFMQDPDKALKEGNKPQMEDDWNYEGAELVQHLGKHNFDSFMASRPHVLALFYAPWCGHCKSMKGDFAGAALKLKDKEEFALAAIDATQQSSLAKKYDIKGYPTILYFKNGKLEADYNGARRKMDFVQFLRKQALDSSDKKDEL